MTKHSSQKRTSGQIAGVLSGVTMLVGGAEVAVAGMMTQTQMLSTPSGTFSTDGQHEGGNDRLNFNLFDSSLGTLTQVDINISNTEYRIDYDPEGIEQATVDTTADTTLSGDFVINFSNTGSGDPFSNPWFSSALSVSVGCSGAGEGSFNCGLSSPTGSDEAEANHSQTYNSNLSNFIGAGTFDVIFDINNTSFTGPNPSIFNGSSGGNVSYPFRWGSGSPAGSFTIEYTYETVPLPGTLLLTSTGLAAFGLLNRRRRKLKT